MGETSGGASRRERRARLLELWDIYDCERRLTGKTAVRGEPLPPGEFHLTVHVWMVNPRGEYLISKRSPNKKPPLLWEATGGAVTAGEDSLTGAVREVKEELGVELEPSRGRLLLSETLENRFADLWLFPNNTPIGDIVLQEGETCDAKWSTQEEIEAMIERGEFVDRDACLCLDLIFAAGKELAEHETK